MGGTEIADFLTHLAVERKVSASTQSQALNALIFLYRKVLMIPLDNFDFKRAKIGKRLPVVLSRDETHRVISDLRVKDVDFDLNEMVVRGGKGDNDRRTILPHLLIPQLNIQLEKNHNGCRSSLGINVDHASQNARFGCDSLHLAGDVVKSVMSRGSDLNY